MKNDILKHYIEVPDNLFALLSRYRVVIPGIQRHYVQGANNPKAESVRKQFSNVQKITSAIFLLQFMFRSIAKNLTKEPCKDVVFILMCSMYFIT